MEEKIETLKKYLPYVLIFVIGFFAGYTVRTFTHTCDTKTQIIKTKGDPVETVKYVDRVQTQVAYVPKETVVYKNADGTTTKGTEKTDIDMSVPKQTLNVKVNGKETAFSKSDTEQYLFEKNKLKLDQTSTADINIKIPTVDNTRKWEIGIGASKNGVAGMVGFPIKSNVGGWVSGDEETVMAGVKIHF